MVVFYWYFYFLWVVVHAALEWSTVAVSASGVTLGLLWPTLADLDAKLKEVFIYISKYWREKATKMPRQLPPAVRQQI